MWGCVPSLLFDLRPNYGGGNEDNGDLLQCPHLQQATTDSRLCRRLLDTHRQVWVSLLRDHCSFLLGPVVHKVLFVPSRLFPQSCVSSGSSMVGLMVSSSKTVYAIPRYAAPTALSNSIKQKTHRIGPPKMDGSWWRVLTKHGPLEKGIANHLSILPLRTPWTVWKILAICDLSTLSLQQYLYESMLTCQPKD